MNNKIQTAIFNNEIGKIATKNYSIEDYIKI